MAEHRRLARPPLREAVIDLRIADELPLPTIIEMGRQRLPDFEPPTQMWLNQVTLPLGPQVVPTPPVAQNRDEPFGWRYTTADGSRIAQLRRNGFTFSVLRGYTTWAEAEASAQRLWQLYCQWGRPEFVTRMAVRYINVLAVPVGADFDLYLTAGPRVAPGLPNVLSGFLHRDVIPFTDGGAVAIVTQALEQPQDANNSVVLDIDVWREFRFPVDSPEIWGTLDVLRDIKNRIFFESVTERALEPYL